MDVRVSPEHSEGVNQVEGSRRCADLIHFIPTAAGNNPQAFSGSEEPVAEAVTMPLFLGGEETANEQTC